MAVVTVKCCPTCGDEFEAQRKTAKYCSDSCRYHAFLVTRKRITIPRDLRFSVLMRDCYRCRYCGASPAARELRVDHVVSVDEGGALTDIDNLVTACQDCNSGKGSRSVDPATIPPPAETGGDV